MSLCRLTPTEQRLLCPIILDRTSYFYTEADKRIAKRLLSNICPGYKPRGRPR